MQLLAPWVTYARVSIIWPFRTHFDLVYFANYHILYRAACLSKKSRCGLNVARPIATAAFLLSFLLFMKNFIGER